MDFDNQIEYQGNDHRHYSEEELSESQEDSLIKAKNNAVELVKPHDADIAKRVCYRSRKRDQDNPLMNPNEFGGKHVAFAKSYIRRFLKDCIDYVGYAHRKGTDIDFIKMANEAWDNHINKNKNG